ncbi:unnamed protein product [Ixodes persulcatus]
MSTRTMNDSHNVESKGVEAIFLGACVVDLISYADRFPVPGETLIGNDFSMGHGGKGANSCVMAVRMGLRCGMIAKVGTDRIGKDYLLYLRDIGLNIDHVQTVKGSASTATANIVVTKDGQNSIVYVHGAAALLTPDDVKRAEDLFKSAKILVAVFECPKATLLEALKLARKYKVATYVNAAPYDGGMVNDVYELTDILCVNETEAGQLTGFKVHSKETFQQAAEALLLKGCNTVIITLGEQGACYCTRQLRTLTYVSIDKVRVEDTTGAGDAFNGAFAYHYARHASAPLSETIKKACDVASITVQSPGTQASYPELADIPARLL